MKPNFALDFRNDAITLLHRAAGGWQVVGEVRLDEADLPGALAHLRATALELSPKSMTTKLVIPNSQILYTRVPVTAPDTGRRRKQVARALEGVTPYAVADLAFDISGTGPLVDVAVIAKETLAEAEAFATEHGFNPVSFVAVPDPGSFASEPWFGPTATAASHIAEGQRVERDSAPVLIPGREPARDPVAAPPAEVSAAPDAGPDGTPPMAPPPEPAEPAAGFDALADPAPADPAPADLPPADLPHAAPARDLEPEEILAQGFVADQEAMPGPAPEAAVPEPSVPEPFAPAPYAPAPFAAEPAAPEAVLPEASAPEPAPPQPFAPEPFAPEAFARAPFPPEPILAAPDLPDPDLPDPGLAAPAPPAASPADAQVAEAPMALDVVEDPADSAPDSAPDDRQAPPPRRVAGVLDPSIPDDLPPSPASSVMVAFGSRRALEASAKEAAAKAGATRPGLPPRAGATGKAPALGNIAASRAGPPAKVTTLPARPGPSGMSQTGAGQTGAGQTGVVRLAPRTGAVTGPVPPQTGAAEGKPAPRPAAKTSAAGKALRGLGALVTSPGIAGSKERRAAPQIVTPPTGPTSAASAAAATLTRPGTKPYSGGLGNRSLERPKPRYLGLILTGILLVFLVLVAAWSTLFLEARDTTAPAADTVVGAAAPPADAPSVADEMAADLQAVDPQAADLPAAAADTAAAALAGTASAPIAAAPTETAPADTAPSDTALSETASTSAAPADADAEAEAVADAVASALPVAEPAPLAAPDTEPAAAAPLVASPQDEFLLATMDAPPEMPAALSLPQPQARNDAPPGAAVPPPPFGTVYQFDAAGLIVPTAEGVLSPEGVPLFAGRPALVPPPRPAGLAPAAAAEPAADPAASPPAESAADTAADPAAAVTPDTAATSFPADPALAGARPRPRPATLAPAAPTRNADDDASLAPADDTRVVSLRPRVKPAALATAATAAAPADPIAALGAQAASLTAQANAATAASATGAAQGTFTLAVSRRPAPRPSDLSAAVEAAVAIASRQPDPVPQAAPPAQEPVARTEPEADDEPEVTTTAPRLPTKTTVAKQATYVNAINLSKINLIGIYGSSSDRYALIRQANGRYKKVAVGDSFDGGRVAAITASEVRYQKSGKMVTLALPKG